MKKIIKRFHKALYTVPIRKSIRVLFLGVFLIPVLTLTFVFGFFLSHTMINRELENVQTSLVQTENAFNNTLNQIQNLSDRIYVNKQLQNVILSDYKNIQDVYSDYANLSFFDNYLHTYKEVASYRIYTENQTLLNNQFINKVTPKIREENWYKNAIELKGQPFWIFKQDSISKKNYLTLIRSLWSATNNDFIGVLVINVNADEIKNTLKNQIYNTVVCFENNILCTSMDNLSEENIESLLNYVPKVQSDENKLKIKKTFFNGERVGIAVEYFSPRNTATINFSIMYIIPIRKLQKATIQILIISIFVIFLMIALSFLVTTTYSRYIDNRVSKIQIGIANLIENNFEMDASIGGCDEFEQIYEAIYEMAGNIKDLIDKIYIQSVEKEQLYARQSEISFKMLSNQINPHFLFNTLETIRMKAITSGEKDIATMLKLLAALLRYNLSVKGKPVPLVDEINAIQNYLTIQHMRFGERVSYDVVTLCDISEINILPLLIQPLVENSFSHGLENRVSGGFIYILVNCEIENNKKILTINVKDNGCGISDEKLEEIREKLNSDSLQDYSNSIGMINVNSRIKLYYGQEYGISIDSEIGEGTTVTIRLAI